MEARLRVTPSAITMKGNPKPMMIGSRPTTWRGSGPGSDGRLLMTQARRPAMTRKGTAPIAVIGTNPAMLLRKQDQLTAGITCLGGSRRRSGG
jgi:hypothetical protein